MKSKLSLGWGQPEYLHQVWNKVEMEATIDILPGRYTVGSREELQKQILSLHKKIHGLTEDYYVVIGYGATNVLGGLIRAISEIEDDGPARVFAQTPHYPRFTSITKLYGGKWVNEHPNTEIITSPNNPDGGLKTATKKTKHKIYDYSYNWPQYTKTLEPLNKDIMVFSLAKITGHADLRIGWALIKKNKVGEQIKKEFEHFIEHYSCGISKQAQQAAEEVIYIISMFNKSFFGGAKEKLDKRWKEINFSKLNFPFKILNDNGMFIFCEGECPNDIEGMNGIDFFTTSDKFRLNIGCNDKDFEEFIKRYGTR